MKILCALLQGKASSSLLILKPILYSSGKTYDKSLSSICFQSKAVEALSWPMRAKIKAISLLIRFFQSQWNDEQFK